MAAPTNRDSDKFIVRLPDGMRDRIKAAAESNNRSMNAEIVATLEESYPAPSYFDRLRSNLDSANKILRDNPDFQHSESLRSVIRQLEDALLHLHEQAIVSMWDKFQAGQPAPSEPSPAEMNEIAALLRDHHDQELAGQLRTKLATAISHNEPKAEIVAEIWEKLGEPEGDPDFAY